ncbi:hypothetical protein Mgra_00006835 [Meloidogyne graminicola]|uniref:Uncharacterized protein n=1 Tax=Meloidogyne graminicola TaxID=189291 RepID=A0A8S9ZK59_9BILA|nr:hypothetical protein Mgra_00006835 [Meloidogyne graminicola]
MILLINNIEELKELENKIILIGKQIMIENDQNPVKNLINKIYKIASHENNANPERIYEISNGFKFNNKIIKAENLGMCSKNNDLRYNYCKKKNYEIAEFDIKFYFKKTKLENKRVASHIISKTEIQHENNNFTFNSNLLNIKKQYNYMIRNKMNKKKLNIKKKKKDMLFVKRLDLFSVFWASEQVK